ncbi:hypothetical protein EON66_05130, partial [archaeon]
LKYVHPLLQEAEFKQTRAAVEEFRRTTGPATHERLAAWAKVCGGLPHVRTRLPRHRVHSSLASRARAHAPSPVQSNKHTSYISDFWYDMYLENRDPLPLNLNPQLTWLDDANPAKNEQAVRAANIVAAALRFHIALENQTLEPDVFHTKPHLSKSAWYETIVPFIPQSVSWYAGYACGAYALDMSQYKRLFGSTRYVGHTAPLRACSMHMLCLSGVFTSYAAVWLCRVPLVGKDILTSAVRPKHIVVQRGPRFYKVDVMTSEGPIAVDQIEAQLRAILADSASVPGSTAWDSVAAASYQTEGSIGTFEPACAHSRERTHTHARTLSRSIGFRGRHRHSAQAVHFLPRMTATLLQARCPAGTATAGHKHARC